MLIVLIAALLIQQPAGAGPARDLQTIAMEGWRAARAIAPKGGAVELLGPVNIRLKELDELTGPRAEYAEAAIRAAVSAAQEERDEMALYLEHARSLSDILALTEPPPQAPLPIDELEGELWFEVDRFADARDAYARAVKLKPTPNGWIGLARSSDKLGDTVTACRAYVSAEAEPNLPTSVELEISLYRLKCQF
jgi:hypothetical protein